MFDHVAKSTLVPLLLRLGVAAIFLYHGVGKVTGEGNEWGAAWARQMPEPPARMMQMAVAWGELLGGAGLALGLLTRVAALGIAAIMVGAIVTVKWEMGFSSPKGGYEYNMLILVVCVSLVLIGGGTLSVDRFFHWRRRVVVPPPPK